MSDDADDYFVLDSYPGDAAQGCCFLTRNAVGVIYEDRAEGKWARPERVIVTPVEVEFEGRVCLSERIVRHLAHRLEMYDGWRVALLEAELDRYRSDLIATDERLVGALRMIDLLRTLEQDRAERVYVALDETEHATRTGALEASRLVTQGAGRRVAPIGVDEAPYPQ